VSLPDLRPLSFGELLDRTFTYYRRHLWTFAGIMAVPQVLIVAVNVAFQIFQTRAMERVANSPPGTGFGAVSLMLVPFGAFFVVIIYFVLYAVALGATTYAVSEIHLGRPTSARAAYRNMRSQYWRLADLIFTVTLRVVLVTILIFGAMGALIGMTGFLFRGLGALAAALMGFAALILLAAGGVLAAWFFLRYGCAVPALLLENLQAGAAIKRSVFLTKKNTGRVFLITVLMALVSWTVALILQGPFFVILIFRSAKTPGLPPLWLTAAMNVAGGIGHAFTGALLMIGLALLYYDIRVRKEGFDLQLMMATLEAQSPVAGSAQGRSAAPSAPLALERNNVLIVILLTVVTLGFYYPYWFIRNRSGINSLNTSQKLGLGVPASVFVVWLCCFVFNTVSGMLEESNSVPHFGLSATLFSWIGGFEMIASLGGAILLLIQAFKVKRILEAHSTVSDAGPFANSLYLLQSSSYSSVATFFFGIFYLQYKINEIIDASGQGPPGAGIIPAV
jgi:hypothetical protein